MDSSQHLTDAESINKKVVENYCSEPSQGVSKQRYHASPFLNYKTSSSSCDAKSQKRPKELLNLKDSGATFSAVAVQKSSKSTGKTTQRAKFLLC